MWDKVGVRGSAIADVFKVWVWAISSLLIGLWLTPVAFNGGKAAAELSVSKDFSGALNKLAAWSGAATLEDFFKICWPVAGLFLFFPLVEWLGLGSGKQGKQPWQLRLPYGAGTGHSTGQTLQPNARGPVQAVVGFLLTLGCFLLIGYAMVRAGAFVWQGSDWWRSNDLWFDIGLALALAVAIEVFFRCIVLGVFLRAMSAIPAVAMAAVMLAGVRLVFSGFSNVGAVDGEMLTAFHLTGILFTGGDLGSRFLVYFLPWFGFGCVLGWARWRTASLWLPAGLLTGWLLAGRLFSRAAEPVHIPDPVAALFSADSIHNGLVPFFGVVVVGWIVHIFTPAAADPDEAGD